MIEEEVLSEMPCIRNVYGEFWTARASELTSTNLNSHMVKRGAEVTFLGGRRWRVVQFEPELLKESDILDTADSVRIKERKYVW